MNFKEPIRWLAGAALALAGACGKDDDTAALDASQNEATASVPEAGEDGDADGGAAAGADAGSDPSLDLPDERIADAADAFCEVTFACAPQMSATYLESEDECPAIVAGFVRDGAAQDGVGCGSAQLDSYECYASVGCDEQFTACEQQADRELEACPLSLGEAQ